MATRIVILLLVFLGVVVSISWEMLWIAGDWIYAMWRGAMLVLLFLLAALGVGSRLLRLCRWEEKQSSFYFLAMGMGLGIVSPFFVMLGLAGLLKSGIFLVLLVAGLFCFLVELRQLLSLHSVKVKEGLDWANGLLIFLVGVFALLYLLAAMTPVVNFDALEYHLALPQTFLHSGKVEVVQGNFYSGLPLQLEMMWTFLLGLEKGWGTDVSPKLLVFALLVLSLWGVRELLKELRIEQKLMLLGLALWLGNRVVFRSGIDALNDMGVAFFTIMFWFCWVKWMRAGERWSFLLMWVALGFALHCKPTVALILGVPFVLIGLPWGLGLRGGRAAAGELPHYHEVGAREVVMGVMLAGVMLVPWLVRNLLWTGNPVYPFLSDVFRQEWLGEEQWRFFVSYAGWQVPFSTGHLLRLVNHLETVGAFLILGCVGALFLRRLPRELRVTAKMVLLGYFIWSLWGSAPDRFLIPLIAPGIAVLISLLNTLGKSGWRKTVLGMLIAYLFYGLWIIGVTAENEQLIAGGSRLMTSAEFKVVHLEGFEQAREFINEDLGEGKMLFLFEARTYGVEREVVYDTVFSRSELMRRLSGVDDMQQLRQALRREGIAYCLVNEGELERYIQFYLAEPAEYWVAEGESFASKNFHLYPPLYLEKEFKAKRDIIKAFLQSLEQRIVFEHRQRPKGLRIFIAAL